VTRQLETTDVAMMPTNYGLPKRNTGGHLLIGQLR
jgi:hypothetical protein